jgi:hypothetical protein
LVFIFLFSLFTTKNEQHDELATIIGIIDGRGGGGDVFRAPIPCRISYAVRAMSSLHRIGLATAAGARRHLLFSPTRFPPRTTLGGVLIASGAAGYAFAGWLHRRHLQETTNAYNDAHYYHERHRRHLVRAARG